MGAFGPGSFENDDALDFAAELEASGADALTEVLERAVGADGVRELKINTSNLKVKPETSHAVTDQWAEIISLPNRTTGTGMKLVFAEPIYLKLLKGVKGKYEKN